MNNAQSCILACNKLLRGELSAIETYHQALEKFSGTAEAPLLSQILDDHQKNADALRDHLSEMGGTPEQESGAWGTFAKAIEGVAKMLGDSSAIAALRQGEEIGITDYENALNDKDVMDEMKTTIRGTLLPRLQRHVATLEGLPS